MANSPVEKTENLPTPEPTDRLYRRANQLVRSNKPFEPAESSAIVAELEALSRPATKVEIAEHLVVMLKGVPKAPAPDYVRILAEDVGASQPSIGTLDLACRNVRRTTTFIPTINQVLKALAAAAKERQFLFSNLGKRNTRMECSAEEMLPVEGGIDGRL
jgi:hypothetical protein